MSLPNQESFILFHPVVYMAKLRIELTMATLIIKLARSGRADAYNYHPHSMPHTNSTPGGRHARASAMPIDPKAGQYPNKEREVALQTFTESKIRASLSGSPSNEEQDLHVVLEGGIQRTREFRVTVHHSSSGSMDGDSKDDRTIDVEDEAVLTSHPGHPKSNPFAGRERVVHAGR